MNILNLVVRDRDGREAALNFPVRRLLMAGFTGRKQEVAMKHVEELREHGVEAPKKIPAFYVVPNHLVATDGEIEVLGNQTSGEVEPVLLFQGGEIYLGVGSDHTDRELERSSIAKSKVMCPKVLCRELWSFKDVRKRWDRLVLRSWLGEAQRRKLYQEARVAAFLPPEKLMRLARSHVRGGSLDGMILFLGTIPILGSGFGFSAAFSGELADESKKRKLSFSYQVKPIRWLKGDF